MYCSTGGRNLSGFSVYCSTGGRNLRGFSVYFYQCGLETRLRVSHLSSIAIACVTIPSATAKHVQYAHARLVNLSSTP